MVLKKKKDRSYTGYANAKINFGLRVLCKRRDGYHNLETIFYPVKLADKISVKIKKLTANLKYTVSVKTTPLAALSGRKNICFSAAEAFLNRFKISDHSVHINIKKNIPSGAGLGGGSSDAAFVLKTLARHFKLRKKRKEIFRLALNLGSDVPFFLINKPAYAAGRGEKLTLLTRFKIRGKILIVNPGIHISTPWAFKKLAIKKTRSKILDKIKLADLTDKRLMINDFEKIVFKKYPEIEKIKYNMLKFGAVYSLLSGSGSTVYGVFDDIKDFAAAKKYFNSEKYLVIEG